MTAYAILQRPTHLEKKKKKKEKEKKKKKRRKKEVIKIIIIAFKGAFRDFLQSPHSAVNCLRHVRSSDLGTIV